MKISKIEHLGIAVPSIEEALPYYEQVLGFECYNIETVEDQKVRTAFLRVGETKIELLEPTSPESTIAKFLETRGQGIHHIAYKVEDGVANALAECEEKQIRTIDKAPRGGAEACPTLCDPMNRSTPGLPVHHQLLEFTQTHVYCVGDAI